MEWFRQQASIRWSVEAAELPKRAREQTEVEGGVPGGVLLKCEASIDVLNCI